VSDQIPIEESGAAPGSASQPTLASNAGRPGEQSTFASDGAAPPPAPPWYSPEGAQALADERPEVAIGAAFAGGFLLAMILRRLAR